jgi:hypothetical protein
MTSDPDHPNWYKFKVFGYLRPGFLKVAPIAPPSPPGLVQLFDLFIDELPIELVPPVLRMPNSVIWCLVEKDQTVSAASPNVSESQAKHYAA